MRSKYLEYQDEIIVLFDDGTNYIEISRFLIDKYNLEVSVDYLRKTVKDIVHYLIADKEIVQYNIRLAKQKQKFQDLNRIERKAFREGSRLENALVEYNDALIKLLQRNSLDVKLKKNKHQENSQFQKLYKIVKRTSFEFQNFKQDEQR